MLSNTYLKINLDNYRFNINYLKKHSNKNLIAIIKANAYGAVDYKCVFQSRQYQRIMSMNY